MTAQTLQKCRAGGCAETVPPPLRGQSLCPGHFLDRAFDAAAQLLDLCQKPQPLDPRALDWLFSDAAYAANRLALESDRLSDEQKDRLLQLMLCLGNLLEYLRHHSVPLQQGD